MGESDSMKYHFREYISFADLNFENEASNCVIWLVYIYICTMAKLIFRFPAYRERRRERVVFSPSSSSYKDKRGMISVITKARCPYHA